MRWRMRSKSWALRSCLTIRASNVARTPPLDRGSKAIVQGESRSPADLAAEPANIGDQYGRIAWLRGNCTKLHSPPRRKHRCYPGYERVDGHRFTRTDI